MWVLMKSRHGNRLRHSRMVSAKVKTLTLESRSELGRHRLLGDFHGCYLHLTLVYPRVSIWAKRAAVIFLLFFRREKQE